MEDVPPMTLAEAVDDEAEKLVAAGIPKYWMTDEQRRRAHNMNDAKRYGFSQGDPIEKLDRFEQGGSIRSL